MITAAISVVSCTALSDMIDHQPRCTENWLRHQLVKFIESDTTTDILTDNIHNIHSENISVEK